MAGHYRREGIWNSCVRPGLLAEAGHDKSVLRRWLAWRWRLRGLLVKIHHFGPGPVSRNARRGHQPSDLFERRSVGTRQTRRVPFSDEQRRAAKFVWFGPDF